MLIRAGDTLRVVDPEGEREAGRAELGWAILLLVLAAGDALAVVAVLGEPVLGWAPFDDALRVDPFLGVIGAIAAPVWIGLAIWCLRERRRRRARWTADYAALILSSGAIDVAEADEAVAFASLEAVVVDRHGDERAITLRTRDGRRIRCGLRGLGDDAELAQLVEAIEQRVAPFGVRVEDARER